MSARRASGILLHPTSLPGPHGSGDLGASAYHFVDWLAAGRQSLWQVLPLSGIGPGNSPYMSPSVFAGNEMLIALAPLKESTWLSDEEILPESDLDEARVDFSAVKIFRETRLRLAAKRFFAKSREAEDFVAFCDKSRDWLDDYALFKALDKKYTGNIWQDWPDSIAAREKSAIDSARLDLSDEIDFWKFCQWRFFTQWALLKRYANEHGVRIIGDLPIFVDSHSADVWAHRALFDLNADGRPRVVSGVPPDYFSATGQRWGTPLYAWSAHKESRYSWWIARLLAVLRLCDLVRIDHFRGFESYWEIPADAPNAIGGRWLSGPGAGFFDAFEPELKKARGENAPFRIIAEDLGEITDATRALRKSIGLPGMRILQFAFDGHADNPYLPHNFDETRTVVYTGTHDNDTTVGWWESLDAHCRDYVLRYLCSDGKEIHWDMIRAAMASVAEFAVIPMQDVLGLGAEHRMNRPGGETGCWEWRFTWSKVTPRHAGRLAEFADIYGRQAFFGR
ncbi:MAG: 4-alpha-glucanotransferase [Candidatus Accumulibacter sp.]|jgi:4-alpha-glucanotransferase|nr:4-alpha-glucanotransferase [Accumulibacter sp.]